jgi:hypothetical protein
MCHLSGTRTLVCFSRLCMQHAPPLLRRTHSWCLTQGKLPPWGGPPWPYAQNATRGLGHLTLMPSCGPHVHCCKLHSSAVAEQRTISRKQGEWPHAGGSSEKDMDEVYLSMDLCDITTKKAASNAGSKGGHKRCLETTRTSNPGTCSLLRRNNTSLDRSVGPYTSDLVYRGCGTGHLQLRENPVHSRVRTKPCDIIDAVDSVVRASYHTPFFHRCSASAGFRAGVCFRTRTTWALVRLDRHDFCLDDK